MGFKYEDYCLPLRAPAKLARKMFDTIVNSGATLGNTGIPAKPTRTVFNSVVSPAEYSAGKIFATAHPTYSDTSTRINTPMGMNGITAQPEVVNQTHTAPFPLLGSFRALTERAPYDVSDFSEIRGYLQPMTLTEFCSELKFPQIAGRVYQHNWLGSPYSELTITPLFNSDGTLINEFSAYANKIVPVVTWYYTDNHGTRGSKIQNWGFHYFFTSNTFTQATREAVGVPGGGTSYQRLVNRVNTPFVTYYSVTPPYVNAKDKDGINAGATLNGYVARANQSENIITLTVRENPIYDYVVVAGKENAKISSPLYAVNAGAPYPAAYVTDNFNLSNFTRVPLFNSVDDIIKLFADFGVTVTTDWDAVLNPKPTPDEQATVNPDPPDRELENFPDNDTDVTPINKTYITPSTFGQTMVYNPTTLKNFLSWVCDSTVDISNWARLFANPADVITGINLFNIDIVQHDSARVTARDKTNILGVETAIPNYALQDGYNNIVDGGSLRMLAYYGNYADFTSMTYQMFIPFVGFISLRASDVVNKTIHLYYAVDFSTGAAVAFVNSDDKLIYTSPCSVAGKIPLSVSDKNSQTINNTLGIIGGIGGLISGIASGNVVGGVGSLTGAIGNLQLQTNYANRGSLSATNIYELLPAFIERTRYDLFLPSGEQTYLGAAYQTATGAPTTDFDTVANSVAAGGYLECEFVQITSKTATEEEKAQIVALLKSGIYL